MYSFGIAQLLEALDPYLEEGVKYYPDDMYTDMSTYRIITEIVREKILLKTRDEIPHSVAVEIIDVERNEGKKDKFNINIYVERDSQKGIIIGKNGKMLKDIGMEARQEIEDLLGEKIYLGLWVKVKDDWRKKKPFLKEMGYTSVYPVKEQEQPDGNFPTCDYANPEDTSVFKLSTELADKVGAEICIANDPDGDRVGLAVLDNNGKWFFPNGNQIGILFAEYILNHKKDIPANGTMITTVVSTPLFDTIVKKNGKKALRVLTGFKYIGEKIRQFENKDLDGTFLFGFEESIGYLVGTHVRDKDAVVASMIIAEMATTFKNNGSSIYNEIIKIYEKYGWRLETTIPITKKGKDGLEEIQKIMKSMREKTHTEIAGIKVKEYRDYQKGVEDLPKSDVIQIVLEDETYLTVRPSGTEPKIKFYISVVDSDKKVAEEKLAKLEKEFLNYAENL